MQAGLTRSQAVRSRSLDHVWIPGLKMVGRDRGRTTPGALLCILASSSTVAIAGEVVSEIATAFSGCTPAVGADARCCNLTAADECVPAWPSLLPRIRPTVLIHKG